MRGVRFGRRVRAEEEGGERGCAEAGQGERGSPVEEEGEDVCWAERQSRQRKGEGK